MRLIAHLIVFSVIPATLTAAGPKDMGPVSMIYACVEHPDIKIQISNDKSLARVMLEDGRHVTMAYHHTDDLQGKLKAYRPYFSDGTHTLRWLGNRLEWVIGTQEPVICTPWSTEED